MDRALYGAFQPHVPPAQKPPPSSTDRIVGLAGLAVLLFISGWAAWASLPWLWAYKWGVLTVMALPTVAILADKSPKLRVIFNVVCGAVGGMLALALLLVVGFLLYAFMSWASILVVLGLLVMFNSKRQTSKS